MSSGKVKCTCGWSWNKSDSSKKDMYICHECGRDNSNNMKNGGWLDNYNDSQASAPEGMVGDGYSNVGRDYSPAWGGQFEMGGSIPGAPGFSYARTQGAAPSNGEYAKKTMASAQNGVTKFNANKFIQDRKADTPLQRSINKESNSEDYRKWVDTKEYKDQVKANKIAQDKATIADRKSRILKSETNPLNKGVGVLNPSNWSRENWAESTGAIGDKFRMFPEDPDSFIDEWMNPAVMIGNMASDLGTAPLRAQQEDSYMPYVTSIGVPLITGRLEGIGAKTNKQFVNNLINPLNMVPGYHSAEKAIGKKLGNISTSVAPELRQGLATQGFSNPLGIVDKVVPRPPTPGMLLGMEDSWNNYSPLNLIPGYGNKLSAASSHPNFVGFRKFGNSIDDVIESQSLRPNGSGMGSKQIMSEGNWAEPGKVNENYSGLFEATMNPQIPGSNIKLEKWNKRNGIVGTTQEGDVAIPLTDPGLSFNRRLPFSNRYIPIDKDKLINNQFQLSTQLPYLQSLTEKYGLWAGGAGAAGYFTGGSEGAKENINTLNEYTIDPLINLTKPYYNQDKKEFTKQTSQYKNGGVIKDDRGQWDHPGEVTEINSNEITMKPDPITGKKLTRPLIGVSDTGDVKIMKPGKDYKFKGTRVTEYPVAQEGKDIKLKNEKGKVETINTASPEYAKIYKEGQIQVPNAGEDDIPMFGGELDDVVVKGKSTPLSKARAEYDKKNGREAFINQKKDEYIKGLGESNWFGADRTNFPETVLRDINANYDYNRNTNALETIAKQKGFDLNKRDNWIHNLTPNEREALINSEYSAQLNPNEFAEGLSGLQQIGNTLLPGNPLNFPIAGLTPQEEEEDRNSKLSGFKAFAPLNMPGNAAANYLKNTNTSSYPEYRDQDEFNMPFLDAQRMGNVSPMESMAFNPLTYQALPALSKIAAKTIVGAKNLPQNISKLSETVSEVAPKVKQFGKDVAGNIGDTYDRLKYLQNIKTDKTGELTGLVNNIDNVRDTSFNRLPTNINDLNSYINNLRYNYESALENIMEPNSAIAKSHEINNKIMRSPLGARLDEIGNGVGYPPTLDEVQNLVAQYANALPEGKSFIKTIKNNLTRAQTQSIYNKKKDANIIKEFVKSIGKKELPKQPIEYSAKEKETIAAIRELGKYQKLMFGRSSKVMNDPEALVNINKEILKLDDKVVERLLGVTKSELLDKYKNIVPATKKTQTDITSSPLGVDDLTEVDDFGQPSINDIKLEPPQAIESLVKKMGRSYAENFGKKGIEYQPPSSYPESLIYMAKTDYIYEPMYDARGFSITDALGNQAYNNKLTSQGKVKEQLIHALRKVEASPKDTNFIGSSSLSTDSYPLTLDSGKMMMKKGIIDVNVDKGMSKLNHMGYTHELPKLVLKDINSKIEELEKLSGKKLPRAIYNKNNNQYEVPNIYFTRLKEGGNIRQEQKGLQNLDNLTNFTNYNTKQPGGWLDTL